MHTLVQFGAMEDEMKAFHTYEELLLEWMGNMVSDMKNFSSASVFTVQFYFCSTRDFPIRSSWGVWQKHLELRRHNKKVCLVKFSARTRQKKTAANSCNFCVT